MANQNTHTNYWTIAGDWVPFSLQFCSASLIDTPGSNYLRFVLGLNNDGIVPVGSVESQQYFHHLSPSNHCHQDLLGDGEYTVAEPILLRNNNLNMNFQAPQFDSQSSIIHEEWHLSEFKNTFVSQC